MTKDNFICIGCESEFVIEIVHSDSEVSICPCCGDEGLREKNSRGFSSEDEEYDNE